MPPPENKTGAKNQDSDEDIVISFLHGNQEAFKKLIDRYTPLVFNFALRMNGADKAPDVVQEVFIKVWKNLGRFDAAKASFKTWIFTIARNTATDFLRKKRYYVFSDLEKTESEEDGDGSFSESIEDEAPLPAELLEKLEDKELVEKSIATLRPDYREILLLHYQEELTFDEIGKVLKKPLNTVKSQHRRAVAMLRELLAQKPNK